MSRRAAANAGDSLANRDFSVGVEGLHAHNCARKVGRRLFAFSGAHGHFAQASSQCEIGEPQRDLEYTKALSRPLTGAAQAGSLCYGRRRQIDTM
jgi:hypothetical protein